MNKVLTVTGISFKPVTAVSKTFDTSRISDIAANGQSANVPPITGTTEFMYVESDGLSNHYVVSESVAEVTGATNDNVGAAVDGVSTAEEFTGFHRTRIDIGTWEPTVANANLAIGRKIYDFPEGYITVLACTTDIVVAGATCTATPEVGVGTAIGVGAVATLGAVGATAENIKDGVAMSAISSAGTADTDATAVEADCALLDGHTTPIDLYLNLAGAWGVAEDLTITGTVEIVWYDRGTV